MIAEKLNNLQLELIKLYQYPIEEKQLIEIKTLLGKYFAEKASNEFDKLWTENNWSNETMDEWLNEDK